MSSERRPAPETLLDRIRSAEARKRRAKLKIFFGASAGVGKTFAMLREARERARAGAGVLVGVVETHGRAETAALLEGLDQLPRHRLPYHGTFIEEFDLDAALERRPDLILVDEMAHANAPGSRHARRWQDIEELLAAEIDVYTTLNVQHVESLIDVVYDVTGVRVRETVPDAMIERADEIALVDLPPDDLLQRLREGRVYVPERAEWAGKNFFRKGNLIALRELALQRTAQQVDAQMETYRSDAGIAQPWTVRGRLLVCIGDPVAGVGLVRSARRLADALKTDWLVAHVETPGALTASKGSRERMIDVMSFAAEFGAETIIVNGLSVRDEILALAAARNVARIVVGRSQHRAWRSRWFGSLTSDLLRMSPVDVWVLHGESGGRPAPAPPAARAAGWRAYAGVAGITLAATVINVPLQQVLSPPNLVMVYLLGVVVSAIAFGSRPAILSAFLSVALFDVLFVPPRYTFTVNDTEYVISFAVMLVVGTVIGTLTARLREQLQAARLRERHAAALHRMSQEMAGRSAVLDNVRAALARVEETLDATGAVLLPGPAGSLEVAAGGGALFGGGEHELAVAQWAFDHRAEAGAGTPRLPSARATYVPLTTAAGPVGVLAVRLQEPATVRDPARRRLLEAFANQIALAVERSRLAESAAEARTQVETERARSALLSSVSHDLRTPLAAITGAATSLRDDEGRLGDETRRELAATIVDESSRLNRLIGNLLEMTRLTSGALRPRTEWQSIEEIVGAALARLEPVMGTRPIELDVPVDLPLAQMDDVLIEQVLWNLIENAHHYSPPGRPIAITARASPDAMRVSVADRGPGLAEGEAGRVFEKFYRGAAGADRRGSGLGLAICRSIVEAHGGTIRAEPRPGGGAVFTMELPIVGSPPQIAEETPLHEVTDEPPRDA